MAYLAGLIITGLFFLVLHYFTELTKTQKFTVSAIMLSVILGAISYNAYQNAQREKMLKVVVKYKQNKTIHCDGRDVNTSTYSLSIGTYTFIGRKGTPHYAEMISASTCE